MNDPTFPADPYAPKPKPFRVVMPAHPAIGIDPSPTVEHDQDRATPPPKPREPTDIEKLAMWADYLRYRDLTKACIEIAGDEEAGKKLAGQIAAWAEKITEKAVTEGVRL